MLEGCLHSRRNNKINKFPPFGNELLTISKNISFTARPIMYPLKQKDLCGYDHICILSSGLVFDDIIMNIIRNNKLAHPTEENDCIFTQNYNNILYMYRGSLRYFYCKKVTYECLEVPCVISIKKRIDMKQYSTHILKSDTPSSDMNEKVDHWLDSFEKFHKKYINMPS